MDEARGISIEMRMRAGKEEVLYTLKDSITGVIPLGDCIRHIGNLYEYTENLNYHPNEKLLHHAGDSLRVLKMYYKDATVCEEAISLTELIESQEMNEKGIYQIITHNVWKTMYKGEPERLGGKIGKQSHRYDDEYPLYLIAIETVNVKMKAEEIESFFKEMDIVVQCLYKKLGLPKDYARKLIESVGKNKEELKGIDSIEK